MKTEMNLLFDLDGTLTDSFRGITNCISHALVKLGRPSPPRESLRWCIGPPLKNSFVKLLASDCDKLAEEALVLYRERYGAIGLFENQVYEDIPEVLDALIEAGHTLYVATAKPAVHASRIIDHFGLRRCFKGVYGSELDGTRSDKTSLISHVLQSASIDSSDTLMIGDRKHDIIGARANGLRGFGVLWGYGSKEELVASGAHTCIAHPRELLSSLRSDPA
jgi:phosphoglycolate phosphatase